MMEFAPLRWDIPESNLSMHVGEYRGNNSQSQNEKDYVSSKFVKLNSFQRLHNFVYSFETFE